MSRFLLAENPMHPEQSGVWVIHTLNPKAMIQCLEGSGKTDAPHLHCEFKNKNGDIEQWTLSAYHFFTTDFLTDPQEQAIPLLKKAWRWYRAYLEWEENQIESDEE